MVNRLLSLPLFLLLTGIAAIAMYLPAIFALQLRDFHAARTFFYAGTLILLGVAMVAVAQSTRPHQQNGLRQLLAMLGTFTALPLVLAVPVYEAIGNTSFVNAYFEMVSAITTTGATVFPEPERLSPALHLWRAEVGWLGGLLMWIAAAAILAPLNLGGFEVTASNEPGQDFAGSSKMARATVAKRLQKATVQFAPIYAGLTGVLWLCLMIIGHDPFESLCHAMSVMSTSGISPIGGFENASTGVAGEIVVFFFLFFALSRLTFSTDTITTPGRGVLYDPEFRIGMVIVMGVPLLLFLRHWIGAYDVDDEQNLIAGFQALWGGVFTVLSFLTTTGFASTYWAEAQGWSGLQTPGLILLGLSLVGGGVATTAGGVKLLRVYALYLNGMREAERLVHPSSVGRSSPANRRLRRQGAFVAWIFFMLFALSLTATTVLLAAFHMDFENAIVLAIAALSTTGPLITLASETPVALNAVSSEIKLTLCGAMVLGRLEMLAIIALFTPDLWRN